jgi:hypothetical protein
VPSSFKSLEHLLSRSVHAWRSTVGRSRRVGGRPHARSTADGHPASARKSAVDRPILWPRPSCTFVADSVHYEPGSCRSRALPDDTRRFSSPTVWGTFSSCG